MVSGTSSGGDASPTRIETAPLPEAPMEKLQRSGDADDNPHTLIESLASSIIRLEEGLARPPQVVLLGEGNVGKTSVANLLLGQTLLPTSVIENTSAPMLLRYSKRLQLVMVTKEGRHRLDESQLGAIADGVYSALEVGLASDRLRIFEILDTPGATGATWLAANPILRASRLVLWCTSAVQAWKESEQQAWSQLSPELRRHAILVVTHKDHLRSEEDCQRVEDRLMALTQRRFRCIVFVSGRRPSLSASLDPLPWLVQSGIRRLEAAIIVELTAMRIRRIRGALRLLENLSRLLKGQRREFRNL